MGRVAGVADCSLVGDAALRGNSAHSAVFQAQIKPHEDPMKTKSGKRELIAPRGDKRYVRRDAKGRIKESDDVSRSLSQDRQRKAKTVAKPGQGDRGDRTASRAKRTTGSATR